MDTVHLARGKSKGEMGMCIGKETAKEYLRIFTQNKNAISLLQVMAGTRNFILLENGLRFDIHGTRKYSWCGVFYDEAMDLFGLKFYRGGEVKKQIDGLFADQLKGAFERNTGIFLDFPQFAGFNV